MTVTWQKHAYACIYNEAQAPTTEMAVTPPSIKKSAPTTYTESSDARYTASFAISNGSAIRLLGLLVRRTSLTALPCSSPGKRPNIAVSVGPGLRVFTRIPRSTSSALRIRARWTTAAVQVPELPLDRGEHRVEVGEIADVRANGETSGSKRLLGRPQRPYIQAANGDPRALSVEFLRCGQPDPAVAAGDKDLLSR